jgi:hypothetical protein
MSQIPAAPAQAPPRELAPAPLLSDAPEAEPTNSALAVAKNDVPLVVGDRVKNPKQKGYGTVVEVIDGDEIIPKRILITWDTNPGRKQRRYWDPQKVRKVQAKRVSRRQSDVYPIGSL